MANQPKKYIRTVVVSFTCKMSREDKNPKTYEATLNYDQASLNTFADRGFIIELQRAIRAGEWDPKNTEFDASEYCGKRKRLTAKEKAVRTIQAAREAGLSKEEILAMLA